MNASTREEVEAFRLLALRSALKLEAVGMKSSKGRSAFGIVKRMTGINARSARELLPIYEEVLRDMGVLRRVKNNPRRPSQAEMSGPRPQVGRYTSFRKWVEAVRNLGKEPQSDSPVPQVVYGPFNIVSEWNGKSGTINEYFDYNPLLRRKGESERDFMARCMSQEKKSFPKQKQRVAVCLSKSRRNPYYDRNLDS